MQNTKFNISNLPGRAVTGLVSVVVILVEVAGSSSVVETSTDTVEVDDRGSSVVLMVVSVLDGASVVEG